MNHPVCLTLTLFFLLNFSETKAQYFDWNKNFKENDGIHEYLDGISYQAGLKGNSILRFTYVPCGGCDIELWELIINKSGQKIGGGSHFYFIDPVKSAFDSRGNLMTIETDWNGNSFFKYCRSMDTLIVPITSF